jgi:hypothetical protein
MVYKFASLFNVLDMTNYFYLRNCLLLIARLGSFQR